MQIVILNKNRVKGKTGAMWNICNAITEEGENVQLFLTDDQVVEYGISDSVIASKKQIEGLFEELPVVDAEFNSRGRLVKITV